MTYSQQSPSGISEATSALQHALSALFPELVVKIGSLVYDADTGNDILHLAATFRVAQYHLRVYVMDLKDNRSNRVDFKELLHST